ncbi:MAG: hypothetical protein ACTHN7_12725 [Solirubrobacterales bacterium]
MYGTTKRLLGWALVAGVIGGILAFALYSNEASVGPVNMNAVGGVLLALAVALAIGAAISLVGPLNRE